MDSQSRKDAILAIITDITDAAIEHEEADEDYAGNLPDDWQLVIDAMKQPAAVKVMAEYLVSRGTQDGAK